MEETMAGQPVTVPLVVMERSWEEIARERRNIALGLCFRSEETISATVPEGHTLGVPQPTYDRYRQGLDSACADCVVQTFVNDKPAVVALQRARFKAFGGQFWMMGGAIHAYLDIRDFLVQRVFEESNLKINANALVLMGVYRAIASDALCSTMSPCYVTYLPYNEIESTIRVFDDHKTFKIFTEEDLATLKPHESHPYPIRMFQLALKTAIIFQAWKPVKQ